MSPEFDFEPDLSRVELGSFYAQQPEAVWNAITDPAALERWLMPSTGYMGAIVGSHFLLSVPSSSSAEIACEVLAATPDRAMTWSWMDLRSARPVRWFLSWEVHSHGRGTRLLLTHSGFDVDDKQQVMARNAFARGWNQVLSTKLPDVLARPQS